MRELKIWAWSGLKALLVWLARLELGKGADDVVNGIIKYDDVIKEYDVVKDVT
jgi:hypothetical protein